MITARGSTIAFLDEGASSPRYMEVGEALSAAVSIAAFVNTKKEKFAISFTSLFIGLVAVPDTTGAWLRKQFERSQADLYNLLRRRGVGISGVPDNNALVGLDVCDAVRDGVCVERPAELAILPPAGITKRPPD